MSRKHMTKVEALCWCIVCLQRNFVRNASKSTDCENKLMSDTYMKMVGKVRCLPIRNHGAHDGEEGHPPTLVDTNLFAYLTNPRVTPP